MHEPPGDPAHRYSHGRTDTTSPRRIGNLRWKKLLRSHELSLTPSTREDASEDPPSTVHPSRARAGRGAPRPRVRAGGHRPRPTHPKHEHRRHSKNFK